MTDIAAGSSPPQLAVVSAGDYIQFFRIIQGAKRSNIKDSAGKQHGGIVEVERVVERGGSGQVLRVNRAAKTLDGEKYRVARVDAGPALGTVTAVLDDAVIIGVNLAMDCKVEEFSGAVSMYDTQGSGA